MDRLQRCAKAFEQLLKIQYRIVIGRKGKTTELVIGFSKLDFHHLMGLGKLKDLRIAKRNRGLVFDEILRDIFGSVVLWEWIILFLTPYFLAYLNKSRLNGFILNWKYTASYGVFSNIFFIIP